MSRILVFSCMSPPRHRRHPFSKPREIIHHLFICLKVAAHANRATTGAAVPQQEQRMPTVAATPYRSSVIVGCWPCSNYNFIAAERINIIVATTILATYYSSNYNSQEDSLMAG
jgi:hypothetical protein